MANMFAYRQHEVVNQEPSIQDLKDSWPALFTQTQVRMELQWLKSEYFRIYYSELSRIGHNVTWDMLASWCLSQTDHYAGKTWYFCLDAYGSAHSLSLSFYRQIDRTWTMHTTASTSSDATQQRQGGEISVCPSKYDYRMRMHYYNSIK